MNWQKFIGLTLSITANSVIYNISSDWRMPALAILVGLGGLVYGDAD